MASAVVSAVDLEVEEAVSKVVADSKVVSAAVEADTRAADTVASKEEAAVAMDSKAVTREVVATALQHQHRLLSHRTPLLTASLLEASRTRSSTSRT